MAGRSGIESLWGGGGAKFSSPVQTGPEALYNGYQISYPGLRRQECGVSRPQSSAEVKERVELYLSWAFMACYRVKV